MRIGLCNVVSCNAKWPEQWRTQLPRRGRVVFYDSRSLPCSDKREQACYILVSIGHWVVVKHCHDLVFHRGVRQRKKKTPDKPSDVANSFTVLFTRLTAHRAPDRRWPRRAV